MGDKKPLPLSPLIAKKRGTKTPEPSELGYQHTLMLGRYTTDLSQYAKEEARRVKVIEKRRRYAEKLRKKELRDRDRNRYVKAFSKGVSYVWSRTFARLGEDWVFLGILGILMAIISFLMDRGISMCNKARLWFYMDMDYHIAVQYFAWIVLPISLVLFATGFVHIIEPQAIGSGIPEMKTILRGVTLKEYLTFRTLVAKVVGLTASLGSGMPLGKEGPFVHIASIMARLLTKMQSFHGIYENQSRSNEMLAAACAVGVACCFASPVGGVLFSIEVTAVYFAVRNYWRGFFAAGIGALFFRLLAVWFQGQETIKPVFKTSFESQFPYDPVELLVYALMGLIAGVLGALYVWVHRRYVLWFRANKKLKSFLEKNRFIYPCFIAWFISSLHFPLGFGQFIGADLDNHGQVVGMFANFSWTKGNLTAEEASIVSHWVTPYCGPFVTLSLFMAAVFFLSIIASTLPIPSGNFVPVFKIGCAFGRICGELMHQLYPLGIQFSGDMWPIIPGGYAVVGAAAVAGAVTRTISIAVIVVEMTGQITHIIPVMVAVLISNAVAGLLQPSIFDSILMLKKLPYLPDFIPSSSTGAYQITVKDFMVKDVKFIWRGMSYKELKNILKANKPIRGFPLVEDPKSMILLGSIARQHLSKAIERQIGRERRIQEVAKRHREAAARAQEVEDERKRAIAAAQQRRPSRFEVVPVISVQNLKDEEAKSSDSLESAQITVHSHGGRSSPLLNPLNGKPKKSILKKTNSFSLYNFGQSPGPFSQHYTVTGAESRLRNAFHTIFQKSATLPDADPSSQTSLTTPNATLPKKTVQLPKERVIDMSPEEQKLWEEDEMKKPVDFNRCPVDAAPFQLVSETALLKAHSLFSLLGINLAYVTATGKLIGVVGMKELRKAIEDCNAGIFRRPSAPAVPVDNNSISIVVSPSETLETDSKDELTLDSAADTEEIDETTDDEVLRRS